MGPRRALGNGDRCSGSELGARARRSRGAALAAAALALAAGCAALAPRPLPPVPRAAVALHAEGEARRRDGDAAGAARAYADAAEIAPDWAPPQRALDDLDRAALLGPRALERRREAVRERPGDPVALYLLGRLEGAAGVDRYYRALLVDRRVAWPHHGLAWTAFRTGDAAAARRHGADALARARDPVSRAAFAIALAHYELALDRPRAAVGVLEARLAEEDLLPADRVSVEAWLARAELATGEGARVDRGLRRTVRLLVETDPAPEEIAMLLASALDAASSRGRPHLVSELASALGARDGPIRTALRAALYLESGAPGLGMGLLRRARPRDAELAEGALAVQPRLERAARFATGEAAEAVEEWLARLPAAVVAGDGLPRDERLREVVRAARAGDEARLAEALVRAGWFEEARALARTVAPRDLELALAVDGRATAALALLGGIERLFGFVDRGEPYGGPFASAHAMHAAPRPDGTRASSEPLAPLGPPRPIGDLGSLLDALEPLFATYGERLPEDRAAPPDLAASPIAGYGPVGAVVHPGPVFSVADAMRGLGQPGAPVPGLAAELDRLGRFGIFGQALGGGGPDGTVLRRLLVERQSGVHLGVPWSGTVAWCEGADVRSRPGRRGARIAGAALHEGYWIDVEAVRADLARWRALERSHFPDGEPTEGARAALAHPGLPVDPARPDPARLVPVLGEGDRVRLAVLAERLAARAAGERPADVPSVDLEELVRVTALHEEGHLCDRSRFLPLGRNLLGVLRLAFRAGLSPEGIARLLEYRAQLVALCVASDPRLPLAECLDGAELGLRTTPHARAYEALTADLLRELDHLSARDPEALPRLDRSRHFVHQLHALSPEEVRRAALALAERHGMVEG